MPELPEVETVKNGLEKIVIGRIISSANIFYDKIIKGIEIENFKILLQNSVITKINRHGKYLFFTFLDANNTEFYLVCHLRMTGQLFLVNQFYTPDKHCHLVFTLKSGEKIVYRDIRKFGGFSFQGNSFNQESYLQEKKIGKDALEITFPEFSKLLKHKEKAIKCCLLDQTLVAGIGNIYADEILFSSRVHPEKKASQISPEKIKEIHRNMQNILKKAIFAGGTSISDYINSYGEKGKFQYELNVYQRDGHTCKVCDQKIKKMNLCGRSTRFCPECQKK